MKEMQKKEKLRMEKSMGKNDEERGDGRGDGLADWKTAVALEGRGDGCGLSMEVVVSARHHTKTTVNRVNLVDGVDWVQVSLG